MQFDGLRVIGIQGCCLRYAKDGADELLYIDAVASLFGRNSHTDLLLRQVKRFLYLTAGGGVRSVSDARLLLASGADKVAVNTAALERPGLITELAEAFGSQCVVASIQARNRGNESWEAMKEAGRERTGRDVTEWIKYVEELGAGEILLTSVDQDGTCTGPDEALIEKASKVSQVPLVVGGGFGNRDQIQKAFEKSDVSAVSLGAALHNSNINLSSLKYDLEDSTSIICISKIISLGIHKMKQQLIT